MDQCDLEKGEQIVKTLDYGSQFSPTTSTATKSSWNTDSSPILAPESKTTESSSEKKPGFFARLLQRCRMSSKTEDKPQRRQDDEYRQVTVTKVHGGPLGYPLMARYLDSDDNYMAYRRFGHIQSRLLLEAQDDLRRLESELEDLDMDETTEDKNSLCSRGFRNSTWSKQRQSLMKDIKVAYNEYATLMGSAQTLLSLNRPTNGEWTSVENFINNQKPVRREEFSFIYAKEDLVTLRPGRDHAWLDTQIEKLLKLCDGPLTQKLFCSEETKRKAGESQGDEVYFTRERIEICVNCIIITMILVLLILPVYILYHLTSGPDTTQVNALCMGVLLIFTLLFAAQLSFFTRAKRHETLAAAAGYCAVLVVFIGNVSNRGSSSVP